MRQQDEEERRQAQINIEQFKSFIARRRWKVHMHCESRSIRTITTKYSDSDGNIKSKPETTLEVIKYINSNGKYYGYHLNMEKG